MVRIGHDKMSRVRSCVKGLTPIMKFSNVTIEMVAMTSPSHANRPCENTLAQNWKSLTPQIGDFLNQIGDTVNDISTLRETLGSVKDFIEQVKKTLNMNPDDNVCEAILARIEGLLFLVIDLFRRDSLNDMILPMMQYIHSWAPNRSISVRLTGMLTRLLSFDSSDTEVELTGQSGWFSKNWITLVDGQFGQRLASAINLLIMVGVCPENVQAGISDEVFKILHVQSVRKNHPSIFHHLFSTLDWMLDSVIPAIETKNYSLLLYDSDYNDLDDMYRISCHLVQLSIAGQMQEALERYGINDEAELIVFLTKATAAHSAIKSRLTATDTSTALMRREIQTRLIKLDKLIVDIQAHWHESGLRAKPFAVLIRGPSSIGKSTLSNIIVHAISQSMGFPEGPEYCVTLNGSDKYQSEYRSRHICAIFDDVGNTKPEMVNENPLFVLIQFINNMHCSALSPEADKKGKMDIRCKIVIVTTNTIDLHAPLFSVNPASIMRRFDLILDAQLRDCAKNENGGIHGKYAGIPQPDAWLLDLKRVQITRSAQNVLADKYSANLIRSTDVIGLIDYLGEVTPDYYADQDKVVQSSTTLHTRDHCSIHPAFVLPCPKCARSECSTPVLEGQVGCVTAAMPDMEGFLSAYMGSRNIEDRVEAIVEEPPVEQDPDWISCVIPPLDRIASITSEVCTDLRVHVHKLKKTFEKSPQMQIIAGIAALGLTAVAFHGIFSPKRIDPEGAVYSRIAAAAKGPSKFVERDNVFQKVYTNRLEPPGASISSTIKQLETKIDRNLFMFVSQEYDEKLGICIGKKEWANAFPVGNCRWITVGHQFKIGKTYEVNFQSHPSIGIKRFSALINDDNVQRIAQSDACVIFLPEGGDTADFSKYMYEDASKVHIPKDAPIFVYHAFRDVVKGSPDDYKTPSSYKLVSQVQGIQRRKVNGVGTFEMLIHKAPNHHGFCGSMVFLAGQHPILLGFHSAGDVATQECAVTLLTKDMLDPVDDVAVLEESPLPESIMGHSLDVQSEVHPFNPIHYFEDDKHSIEAYGQHQGPGARFNSDVIPSPLLPYMKEILEYEPTHGAPKKRGARPSRRRHMLNTTSQLPPTNPTYLKMAKMDFKQKLEPLVSNKVFQEFVHPLSYEDAVNGVPGIKGFDPINVATAMGFNIPGPKWKYLVQSGLEEEMGIHTTKFVRRVETSPGKFQYEYDIIFDKAKADVHAENDKITNWWHEGKRVNVVFKTHLKDEPVTFKKIRDDKIRIFAGGPVTMVIICRQLTLPLINMMTHFPAEFESAVGVNASGKDWEEIYKIVTKFNENRSGDGDFSAFDNMIRPGFSKGGFDLLRWILSRCGFSDDLLKVFDGLATECIFPVYESDGFIFKALGSNPSGHPLTVIINGLVNGLYMRYAYYAMHSARVGQIPLFHEVISLVTYGDDNMFNVSEKEDLFDMRTVGEELAKIGVKYTDASKQIATVPFKPSKDLSFLKRSFITHDVLGAIVGPLEKSSIYKSLALCRKPSADRRETTAEICAGNLSGALAELYLHSEDEYDQHLQPFFDIASKAVDDQGNRVMDYYHPVSKEELILRFQQTTCCYPSAQKALEGQSGIFDDDDLYQIDFTPETMYSMIQSGTADMYQLKLCPRLDVFNLIELRDVILFKTPMENGEFKFRNRLPSFEWCENRAEDTYQDFLRRHGPGVSWFEGDGHWLYFPTVNNIQDVNFRYFCYHEAYCIIGFCLEGDYRLKEGFSVEIYHHAMEFKGRIAVQRGVATIISYLCANCQGPNFSLKEGDEKILRIFRKMKRRDTRLALPNELVEEVWSYFDGPRMRDNHSSWSMNLNDHDLVEHMHHWNLVELGFQALVELGHFSEI